MNKGDEYLWWIQTDSDSNNDSNSKNSKDSTYYFYSSKKIPSTQTMKTIQ